jgi:hypothetical protein
MHCLPLLACVFLAAPPEHIAEEITQLKIPFDDLGDALRIQRIHGTLRLREPRAKWSIEIERYKDGKKQTANNPIGGMSRQVAQDCEFSLQVIDLDYLPLRGAPKNSSRLLIKVRMKGTQLKIEETLPKDQGDFFFRKQKSSGVFDEKTSTADRVPLAYFFSSDADLLTYPGSTTPDEYIQKLTNGDLLIVYLRVED